jgi:hypothetical protein
MTDTVPEQVMKQRRKPPGTWRAEAPARSTLRGPGAVCAPNPCAVRMRSRAGGPARRIIARLLIARKIFMTIDLPPKVTLP